MRWILVVFIVLGLKPLNAQQFGGNSPSLKWKQINTPAVRVIFPQGLDTTARDVAAIIDYLNSADAYSLGKKKRKVNLVLQNQTTNSNGYVGLGPFRSEFYLTPLQNSFRLGSLAWHKQLALHEYRHVQQYTNFNVGLSKAFRILFGEEGQALANGMTVPDWFFEGDAVFNETQSSEQGRGRLPYFYNGFRSIWEANKGYSWMKLRNGSYKDYTPDQYQLGYLLVAYGYEKYGNDFWKMVTQDAASFKGLVYPFQRAIKKHTGIDYTSFRKEALDYFKHQFDKEGTKKVATTSRLVTDEEFPAFINDSSLIYVKSSYNKIPAFVIRTGNKERQVRVKDISIDKHFSYRNNKIVYSAYQPDMRWGWKDYGELKVLDIITGQQRSITKGTKYFTPDINEDASVIAAVKVDTDGKSHLHLVNGNDGKLIREINNSEDLFYTYPKFYDESHLVTPVRNKEGQMSLALVDIVSGATDYLVPFSYNVIGFPVVQGDSVYFTASSGNTDQLFAIHVKSKELFKLIPEHDGIGQYQLAIYNNLIAWSSFTAVGFRLQTAHHPVFQPVTQSEFIKVNEFSIKALKKGTGNVVAMEPSEDYQVTRYSKSTRLFNFHSLEPVFDDPDYRFSLVGQNVLNTLQSELYFNYNRNEQFKQVGFNSTYAALFPYLSLGTSYVFDRRAFNTNNQAVYWNEAQARAGVAVPLNLSRGRSITGLTMGADYVIKHVGYKAAFKNLGSYSFSHMNAFTSFTHQIQKAKQHIYPRLAQAVRVDYNRALTYLEANQFVTTGSFYFPGLAPNHSLVVNLAYHQRDTLDKYGFPTRFPFSRGYEAPNLRSMVKWGVNYHLPLAYPDAGVGNIVYLSRLRANLFYDNTIGKVAYSNGLRINSNFRSTGTELFFDTQWWNEFPVTFGVRYSYLMDDDLFGAAGVNRFEFILPINLFQR